MVFEEEESGVHVGYGWRREEYRKRFKIGRYGEVVYLNLFVPAEWHRNLRQGKCVLYAVIVQWAISPNWRCTKPGN